MRIWNGTVVRERKTEWHEAHQRVPLKGVVISQTDDPDRVIVRWEGGSQGDWTEWISHLEVVEGEEPLYDGTRAYS